MNFRHFSAVVSMRWQAMRNQFARSGKANRIVSTIFLILGAISSFGAFVFAIGWGKFFLAKMEPFYMLYVWDAIALLFLFGWSIALMVELQRSEMMSLKNLLHLPVSLSGAFFLNYASSFASLTILLLFPAMLGLCVASVLQFGVVSLVVFALLISFLVMVTAISYQIRGWLARLMENKRTRGTVVACTTMFFIMLFQVPNLINMGTMKSRGEGPRLRQVEHAEHLQDLQEKLTAQEIELEAYTAAVDKAKQEYLENESAIQAEQLASFNRKATLANVALPIGWLPYGASAAARGHVLTPWLCVLGMSAIGLGSLTMAYRSTLRAYTGHHNKVLRAVSRKKSKSVAGATLLEKDVPLLSDAQSAIATATFRSTLRAPEAKMALLTPLIFACVFGSMMLTGNVDKLPSFARPWFGVGALTISVMGMAQMLLNMFGLDRQGFRFYVLSPCARRDILLGKNFGLLPFAATLGGLLVIAIGILGKMAFSHIVATLIQIPVTYFLYFLVGNYTSIYAPLGLASGTMKPVSMKFSVIVLQMLAVILVPVAVLPATLAVGAEQLAHFFGVLRGVPICLLVTLIQLPVVGWIYSLILGRQGRQLQEREQEILVTISRVAD